MPGPGTQLLVPFVHVADVQRSAEFYRLLGFEITDTHEQDGWLLWCWMQSGDARVMFALAGEPVHQHGQGVLFYLYASDLEALHSDLRAAGMDVGEICDGSPGPEREFRVQDPDGYVLMVAQHPPRRH